MGKTIALTALAGALFAISNVSNAAQGQAFDPLTTEDLGAVPYNTQMNWLNKAPDLMLMSLSFRGSDLDAGAEENALKILTGVEKIINYQSRLSSIVPSSTKNKLLAAVRYLKSTVSTFALKAKNEDKENGWLRLRNIKKLKERLTTGPEAKSVKIGMLDVLTTPIDLKNGINALFEQLAQIIDKFAASQQW